jgi:hypothetical protein
VTRVGLVHDPADPAQRETVAALVRHAPADVDVGTLVEGREDHADVVLILDAARMREGVPRGRRQVALWSHPWPEALDRFHSVYRAVNAVLFESSTYHRMLGRLPATWMTPRGFDPDVFQRVTPWEGRPTDVLWMGRPESRQRRRGEPIVSDPVGALGRHGLSCRRFPDGDRPVPELRAALYNSARLVVCDDEGRRHDLLEAAACGCRVLATPGVALPEWCADTASGPCATGDLTKLPEAIRERLDAPGGAAAASLHDMAWPVRAREMFARLRPADPGAAARPDLRDQVTAFVTTVGAASYEACRDHLRAQDCDVRVEVIERVAPMSAAFQRMLDTCRTPYYVQVDEDMLLYPGAIRALHERITAAPPRIALAVAWLHDVHLDRAVQGVKIFRHELVRRYPYRDVNSCELDQLRGLAADGFGYEVIMRPGGSPEILGLHGTHWTPRAIYERFCTLERARRRHPSNHQWLEPWPAILVERVLERRSPLDLYALMGLVAGAVSPLDGEGREKDFRTYGSLPGFDAVDRYWQCLDR